MQILIDLSYVVGVVALLIAICKIYPQKRR